MFCDNEEDEFQYLNNCEKEEIILTKKKKRNFNITKYIKTIKTNFHYDLQKHPLKLFLCRFYSNRSILNHSINFAGRLRDHYSRVLSAYRYPLENITKQFQKHAINLLLLCPEQREEVWRFSTRRNTMDAWMNKEKSQEEKLGEQGANESPGESRKSASNAVGAAEETAL